MIARTVLTLCRALMVLTMLLSLPAAHAGMTGDELTVSAASGERDGAAVLRITSRSDVSSQLESQIPQEGGAATSGEEAHALPGQLDTFPAGGDDNRNWGWGLAAVIAIAAAIYLFHGWK